MRIASLVVGPGAAQLRELEETTKGRFFLVGVEGLHLDHFRVLEQGTVEKLAPVSPLEVGQELELKLGQVGLYDAHAGVATVEGVDVPEIRRGQVLPPACGSAGRAVASRKVFVTCDYASGQVDVPQIMADALPTWAPFATLSAPFIMNDDVIGA